MASLLQAYQARKQMSDEQLVAFLGCAPERLPLLGLCAQPRSEPGLFSADVRRIAEYAGADVGRLAQLIRAVEMDRTLAGTQVLEDATGYAAAARDREEAPESTAPDAASDTDDEDSESGEADGRVG